MAATGLLSSISIHTLNIKPPGYIIDSFEGINRSFTDVETLHESEANVVFKAKRYGRWWLLKTLRPELANQENFRQRLRKEFELMVLLQHPSIVSAVGLENVEGIGESIVMEYIDGEELSTTLAKGDCSLPQRRRMAVELIEALEYIHAKGIASFIIVLSLVFVGHHHGVSSRIVEHHDVVELHVAQAFHPAVVPMGPLDV